MIKDYANQKLPRFKAGKDFYAQVTAERLNDILAVMESCRLQSGVGYLLTRTPQGTTLNIKTRTTASSASKNPFSLYVSSSDDEYSYIAVRPALVNDIVPNMLNAYVEPTDDDNAESNADVVVDTLTSIEEVPAPKLQVSKTGRVELYLYIVIERESEADTFSINECYISTASAEEDSPLKITHRVKLGYLQDGVATSYHSTSLNAEVCEESVTVWAT